MSLHERFAGLRMVDLSVTLSEHLPCTWPGHMQYAHKNWNYYAPTATPVGELKSAAPYQTFFLVIDEHCGTHFDAPPHFIPPAASGLPWAGEAGSEYGHQVPLGDLSGPAVVIDVRHLNEGAQPGISPFVTAEHIKAWEAQHGALQPGEIVLLRTGWDQHYVAGPAGQAYSFGALVTQQTPGWPSPDPSVPEYLLSRGVPCLGVDTPSVGAAHEGAPVHRVGLSQRIRYIELLAGLGQLPLRGAYFMFLPLKIEGSTGGPGRAIAWLEA